jgi:hypothetical protein
MKIKNVIHSKNFQKLFLLFFSSFIFIFLPSSASAGFWDGAMSFLTSSPISFMGDAVGDAMIAVISSYIGALTVFLLDFGSLILGYALKGPFLDSSGASTPIVTAGWGIVRNLANSVLVIGLVIIAINIILGKEEGKAKKTLVNFIIAAILINFTPVICGFVIDGANTLARSFVSSGLDGDISTRILEAQKAANDVKSLPVTIGNMIFLVIFAIVSFIIYILYAILFIARSVVLQILIIVSPLAVATKVFPQSNIARKVFPSILFWDEWIENFSQWCLLAIPAGLFIFLANASMDAIINPNITNTAALDDSGIINKIMISLFEYLVPLIILLAGFFISISSGGSIAAPIGNIARKGMNYAKGAAVGAAVGGTVAAGKYAKEGAVGSVGAALQRKSPLNFENRDSGRMAAKGAKEQVWKTGREIKETLHVGKENTFEERTARATKDLTESKELKGGNSEETTKEIGLLLNQKKVLKIQGDEKGASKLGEAIAIAIANSEHVSEEEIARVEKEGNINIDAIIKKMSPKKAAETLNHHALQKKNVVESLNQAQINMLFREGSEEQQDSLMKGADKIDLTNTSDYEKDSAIKAKVMLGISRRGTTESNINQKNEVGVLKRDLKETQLKIKGAEDAKGKPENENNNKLQEELQKTIDELIAKEKRYQSLLSEKDGSKETPGKPLSIEEKQAKRDDKLKNPVNIETGLQKGYATRMKEEMKKQEESQKKLTDFDDSQK